MKNIDKEKEKERVWFQIDDLSNISPNG